MLFFQQRSNNVMTYLVAAVRGRMTARSFHYQLPETGTRNLLNVAQHEGAPGRTEVDVRVEPSSRPSWMV